jgi:hypothetical protein
VHHDRSYDCNNIPLALPPPDVVKFMISSLSAFLDQAKPLFYSIKTTQERERSGAAAWKVVEMVLGYCRFQRILVGLS